MYRYFYFPDRVKYDTPERLGLPFEEVFFTSADKTTLSGWYLPAIGEEKGVVVHMHGNAQNMTAHWEYAGWLPQWGYSTLVFDYRGYGQSHGRPEPQGIFDDAVAAIDYACSKAKADKGRIYVFGQSLGGMLAIAAGAQRSAHVRAVVAEAPIYSYTMLAEDQMPAQELVMDDSYCASTFISKLASVPLLLLHSPEDKVVPYGHSVQLRAEAGGNAKLETIQGGQHNDAMTEKHGSRYRDMMLEFFAAN